MNITPVSDKAFAMMAMCPNDRKYYGITVDYIRKNAYKFGWAFKIDKDKASREGYDTKWYINAPDEKFYKNLEHNIMSGPPSAAFLWPEYLTRKEKGSYGYVMRLRHIRCLIPDSIP